jgi:alanyl-tRNA synthetase
MGEIAERVIREYGQAYPELAEKREYILQVISREESRFLETLEHGLQLLQRETEALSGTVLPGAAAFKLYDTYGFPLELMTEILSEKGFTIDAEGFKREMESQRERARAARGASSYLGAEETAYDKLPAGLATAFCGYETETAEGRVLALISGGEMVREITPGQEAVLFLDKTPFYAESGGQKGDIGLINAGSGFTAVIKDCVKAPGGQTAHIGTVERGSLKVGDTVTATVDPARRRDTACHHSATHLLQKALREVLGEHVEQAGSEVSADRLRFDFTETKGLSAEDWVKVEDKVNRAIQEGLAVTVHTTTPDKAREMGAVALFGEKYGDTVRVVRMGGHSIELCGGTHVRNTRDIVLFTLVSEGSVASGVRRIEAVTGEYARRRYTERDKLLAAAAEAAKTTAEQLPQRVEALTAKVKQLEKELAASRNAQNAVDTDALMQQAETVNGINLLAVVLQDMDADALRGVSDKLRGKPGFGVYLLCGVHGGAAQFLAGAADTAVKAGINCGQIVKQAAALCGGGGGGRPNHAQAGGKDASKATEAVALGLALMKEQLSACR